MEVGDECGRMEKVQEIERFEKYYRQSNGPMKCSEGMERKCQINAMYQEVNEMTAAIT